MKSFDEMNFPALCMAALAFIVVAIVTGLFIVMFPKTTFILSFVLCIIIPIVKLRRNGVEVITKKSVSFICGIFAIINIAVVVMFGYTYFTGKEYDAYNKAVSAYLYKDSKEDILARAGIGKVKAYVLSLELYIADAAEFTSGLEFYDIPDELAVTDVGIHMKNVQDAMIEISDKLKLEIADVLSGDKESLSDANDTFKGYESIIDVTKMMGKSDVLYVFAYYIGMLIHIGFSFTGYRFIVYKIYLLFHWKKVKSDTCP